MNLLMLLSALLSALSGVGAAVRRPEVAQAVAQAAASSDVAHDPVVGQTRRPLAVLPTLDTLARPIAEAAFMIAFTIAPWTTRRRE